MVQNYKKLRNAANLVFYYSEQQLSEIEYLIQQICAYAEEPLMRQKGQQTFCSESYPMI